MVDFSYRVTSFSVDHMAGNERPKQTRRGGRVDGAQMSLRLRSETLPPSYWTPEHHSLCLVQTQVRGADGEQGEIARTRRDFGQRVLAAKFVVRQHEPIDWGHWDQQFLCVLTLTTTVALCACG